MISFGILVATIIMATK
ncbi:hypothetical protein [Veillonella parvula]